MMRLYDEIRDAPLRFPRSTPVSPQLAELLYALLAKDPAQRPTMPQIMAHPWVTHGGVAPMRCLQVVPGTLIYTLATSLFLSILRPAYMPILFPTSMSSASKLLLFDLPV